MYLSIPLIDKLRYFSHILFLVNPGLEYEIFYFSSIPHALTVYTENGTNFTQHVIKVDGNLRLTKLQWNRHLQMFFQI
jgi:hypothetical protein